jgi:hypothetical protein
VTFRTVGLRGRGVAPVRRYIPELLDNVPKRHIRPGCVFEYEAALDGTAGAYAAKDAWQAIGSLVRMGTQWHAIADI